MHYKRELQQCYDNEAAKFSQTRQKHWYEFDDIMHIINNIPHKTVTIVELGCGNGRLYEYIKQHTSKKIHYTGIDFSKGLLKFAKKQHPEAHRVCDDMSNGLKKIPQESCDLVVSVAAFQHLPNRRERNFVLKNVYRILKYDAKYIMVNRAFSDRFYKKYRQQIAIAVIRYIVSLGENARNDVIIPRKGEKRIYHRYYHIFTLPEITNLMTQNWLLIETLWYGLLQANNNLHEAKNSMCVARKAIAQ